MNITSNPSSREIISSSLIASSEQTIKLLLHLLEKAEQILSIINLSESSTQKYNKLNIFEIDREEMIVDKIRRLDKINIDHSFINYLKCDFTKTFFCSFL